MIGTSDQSCWLAEACQILLLLLFFHRMKDTYIAAVLPRTASQPEIGTHSSKPAWKSAIRFTPHDMVCPDQIFSFVFTALAPRSWQKGTYMNVGCKSLAADEPRSWYLA